MRGIFEAGVLGLVVGAATPSAASGDLNKWCVDATVSGIVPGCGIPRPCDNATPFASIAEALGAAAAAPDVSPGVRPALQEICVATPGLHTEDITLDNTSGVYGGTVNVVFEQDVAPTWCPSADGVTLTGDGSSSVVGLLNLWFDSALCPASVGGPLVSVRDALLSGGNVRAIGGTGPFLVQTGFGGTSLTKLRVEGRAGVAIQAEAGVFLTASEISAIQPPSGEAVVTARLLDFWDSAIFGSVTSGGAPLVEAEGGLFRSSVIAGNVALDGAPLMRFQRPAAGGEDRLSIRSTVISRNALVAVGGSATPVGVQGPRAPDPGHITNFCLPEASDNLAFGGRATPQYSGDMSSAALIAFDGGSAVSPFDLDLMGNVIVDNDLSDSSALVRAGGSGYALTLHLIHNTVTVSDEAVVEYLGASTGVRLVSAKNLFLGPPRLGVMGPSPRFEMTMDESSGGVAAWSGAVSTQGGLAGPEPTAVDWSLGTSFRPSSELEALDGCLRARLLCPELTCPTTVNLREQLCALDAASAYVPSSAAVSQGPAWPWATDYFDSRATGDPYNTPGASGWFCEEREPPFDRDGVVGDGDGWTTLVDCDNEAVSTPSVPGADGFNSEDCWDVTDDCYECPQGSNLIDPPLGDDDDSGDDDDDDDDDSSSGSDDDDSSEADDDPALPTAPTGCQKGTGCGAPISVGFLFVAPLLRRRRYRPASSSAPSR
mgnify:CR=1 FL=1